MKRKRGSKSKHKKAYVVKSKEPLSIPVTNEDESGADDIGVNSEALSNLQSEGGSPSHGVGEVNSGGHNDTEEIKDKMSEKPGHGRVRVKLKSSKTIDVTYTSSGVQNSPAGSMQWDGESNEKIEDRMPESEIVAEKASKKLGSIKIKSSRGSGTLSGSVPDKSKEKMNVPPAHRDLSQKVTGKDHVSSAPSVGDGQQMAMEESNLMERCRDSQYNKKELAATLAVIKKVMKMEAAQPFNTPVDPVELGIPDYFDIIETPMDFGTICKDLESGKNYMNSEDVFKDVQYIWSNCYRYNNKGDYILDLMKRVKKNFTKYWSAAGLYCGGSKKRTDAAFDEVSGSLGAIHGDGQKTNVHEEINGGKTDALMPMTPVVATPSSQESPTGSHVLENESILVDDSAPASKEKGKVKGTSTKHKGRRRHGINKHKAGCLCAVCIARRRRRERDVNARILQTEASYGSQQHRLKSEEKDIRENRSNHDVDVDESSEDDVNADESIEEIELEHTEQVEESSRQGNQDGNNNLPATEMEVDPEESDALAFGAPDIDMVQVMQVEEFQVQKLEESDSKPMLHDKANMLPETQDDSTVKKCHEGEQQQEVSSVKRDRRLPEDILNPPCSEVLHMCGTLFPGDAESVWAGPHSLHHQKVEVRDSAIRAAIAMFMQMN